MKRVLIVNEWLIGGGVEKVMFDLVHSLPEEEYDITILTLYEDKDFSIEDIYSRRVKYVRANKLFKTDTYPRKSIRHAVHAIRRKFRQRVAQIFFSLKNYDLLIAMEEGACTKLLSRVRAKKKLAWVHCDYMTFHWTKGYFSSDEEERKCMAQFDHVVCVSGTTKEHVIEKLGDPGNLCVKYNPVDEKKVLSKAKENIETIKVQSKLLFVTVGRLTTAKGYERLQNIFKRLNDEGYLYEAWIIGDGELCEQLHKQKQDLGLENVRYMGNKENPFPYMKKADWFVCSSITEGFSTVLQEAAILGVPIISTCCSGTKELLGESEYGIVVENNDVALYEGMKNILDDASITDYYCVKAKERQDFVNLQNRIEEIKKLF